MTPDTASEYEQWISASQTKKAKRCLREWYYDKVMRLVPIDESPALVLGKQHSTQVEEYLEGKRSRADCMELVSIGIDAGLLPNPQTALLDHDYFVEVECRTSLSRMFDHVGLSYNPVFDSYGYVGFIDLLDYSLSEQMIRDHKTRASARWALGEKQLREDIQMGLYATYADAGLLPGAWEPTGSVKVQHINYLKRGNTDAFKRRAFTTESRLSRLDMTSVMTEVQRQAYRIIDARGSDVIPDGDPTFKACDKFGGCAHQQHCEWYQDKKRAGPFAGIEAASAAKPSPTAAASPFGDTTTMTTPDDNDFFNEIFGDTPDPTAGLPEDTGVLTKDDSDEQPLTVGVLPPEAEAEFDEMVAATDPEANTVAIAAQQQGELQPETPEDAALPAAQGAQQYESEWFECDTLPPELPNTDSTESIFDGVEIPPPDWTGYPTRWVARIEGANTAFGSVITKEVAATWGEEQFLALKLEGIGKGTIKKIMEKLAEEVPSTSEVPHSPPPATSPAPAVAPPKAPKAPAPPKGLPPHTPTQVSDALRTHGYILLLDADMTTDLSGSFQTIRLERLAWAAGEEASAELGTHYTLPRYNKGFMKAADLLIPKIAAACEDAFAAQKIPVVQANSANGQRLYQWVENFLLAHARTIIRG
ncbi:MAG: PD-(D/E)XK nuclease family protein [Actinomycetia bacterium]|nr:PD-(D/E)XK nuclease family protein [Actinomycetes bacterium]